MKKLLLTLAALPAATMAVEASAQTYSTAGGSAGVQTRIANLEARLNAGAQARVFTQQEYANLSSQLMTLRNLERQYSANGLNATERRQLQNRIRVLRDDLRMAGGSGWANRYGWTDRDLETNAYGNAYGNNSYGNNSYGNAYGNTTVRYDQYGRPIQTNGGVVYDQYGRPIQNNGVAYDQYGRPVANGGNYGQGGPYDPVYTPRNNSGGIGNVLGNVLGSNSGGGGIGGILGGLLGGRSLGVGDVITGAIGNVLRGGSNYGTQYRDNGSTYFRSDGERVYEIDVRTNQVVRIHPLR